MQPVDAGSAPTRGNTPEIRRGEKTESPTYKKNKVTTSRHGKVWQLGDQKKNMIYQEKDYKDSTN